MNKQRTQFQQPSSALFCAEHNEPVKGICFSQNRCHKRLLCRTCRKHHDYNHLNFYEELEDLTQAVIVNDIIKEFNNMIRRIDSHNQTSSANTQTLLGKIDIMFNAIHNHVIRQLNQSKTMIIEEINRKFKIDDTNKQKLLASMEELHKTFKMAESNHFQTMNPLDTLIQTIVQAQGLRDHISKDPSMNIQQTTELLALYLEDVTAGRSLQILMDNFDKILQDLTNNFVARGNRGPPRLLPINQEGTSLLEQMAQEYSMMPNQNTEGSMNVESAQPQPPLFPNIPQSANFSFLQPNTGTPNLTNIKTTPNPGPTAAPGPNEQINFNTNALAGLLSPFKQFQSGFNMLNQLQNQPLGQNQQTNPLGFDLQALGQNFNLSSFLSGLANVNQNNNATQQQQPQEEPVRDQMTVDNQGPEQPNEGLTTPAEHNTQNQVDSGNLQNSPDFGAAYTALNPDEPNNGLYQPFFKKTPTGMEVQEMPGAFNDEGDDQIIPNQSQNNLEEVPYGNRFQQTQVTFMPHTQSARASVSKSDGMVYQQRLEEERDYTDRLSYSSMHVESEFRPKASIHKHTPSHLLDIFQKVNDNMQASTAGQEMQNQLNQPLMALNDKKTTPTGMYNPHSAGKNTQGRTPQKRENDPARKNLELLKHQEDLHTRHSLLSTGGVVYISLRNHLVTSGAEGKIQVWDLSKQESIHLFEAHKGDIFRLLYIEEKDVLVTSGIDLAINVWDCKNNYEHLLTFDKHQAPVYALDYLPELNVMASGGEDCQVRFWTIEGGKENQPVEIKDAKIGSICYMRRVKKLAVGCDKGQIHIINVSNQGKKLIHSTQAHDSYIFSMACVEEHAWLITSSDDGLIKVWKAYADRCECIREFGENHSGIRSFGVIPERDLIISNHGDNYLRVWKLSTGDLVMKQFEEYLAECIGVMKNQNKVVTASKSKVRIWKINN